MDVGLFQVRLVDAGFVWTEPHSKRIKVKLTVQKEVRAPVCVCVRACAYGNLRDCAWTCMVCVCARTRGIVHVACVCVCVCGCVRDSSDGGAPTRNFLLTRAFVFAYLCACVFVCTCLFRARVGIRRQPHPVCRPPQVLNGAVLQQTFVVEFTVHSHMCDECHRVEAKDFWRAVVQVRQKVRASWSR